jgi:hypothetical protein
MLVLYPKASLLAMLTIPVLDRLGREYNLLGDITRTAQRQLNQFNSRTACTHLRMTNAPSKGSAA